jgi:Holliday junction resolvase-like predicted endonuclease
MQKIARVKLSPAQILISLATGANGEMKGHVFSGYYHKVYAFASECELLFAADMLCDDMQYPQASFSSRSFGMKGAKTVVRKADDFVDGEIEDIINQEKATFVVHIQFRQSATWQGSITWVEKDRTQNFRSALEMLKLMDEARSGGAREIVDWDGISGS